MNDISFQTFSVLTMGLTLLSSVFTTRFVNAQMADVPSSDRAGNFKSVFQRGNRGYYAIEHWLVVQRQESGSFAST